MNTTSNEIMTIGNLPIKVLRKKNLKNLYINVIPPEGQVEVKAPITIDQEEIRLFALKKLPEIMRVQARMVAQPRQTKRYYVSGEAHYLWGKPYMLQVVEEHARPSIRKMANKLIMTVPQGVDGSYRERLMMRWYRDELKRAIPPIANKCENEMDVYPKEIRIKQMKTKWGTCNVSASRIWLNLQLVKKPPECLEYVLIHELAHFEEAEHTNRFHALVEKHLPSWREAQRLLAVLPLDHLDSEVIGSDVD